MHHLTDRITHTMTFVIPVVEYWLEREISELVMRNRSNDLSPLEQMYYHSAMSGSPKHYNGSIWYGISPC